MFKMLIDFVFWLLAKIAEIIFTPVTLVLNSLFPDLTDLVSGVQSFLNTYVFDTLKWFKMFCVNCLAIPNTLLTLIAVIFEVLVGVYLTMLLYKGILTIYQKLKP